MLKIVVKIMGISALVTLSMLLLISLSSILWSIRLLAGRCIGVLVICSSSAESTPITTPTLLLISSLF